MFCNQYFPLSVHFNLQAHNQDRICCDENSFCMFIQVSLVHGSNSSLEEWWELDKSTGYLSVSHRMWGEVSRDTFFFCEQALLWAVSRKMSLLFRRPTLTRLLLLKNIKQNQRSTICSKPPKEKIGPVVGLTNFYCTCNWTGRHPWISTLYNVLQQKQELQ